MFLEVNKMDVFIDKISEDKLNIDAILSKINPLSPYGKAAKKEIPIYVEGQEDLLIREYNLMEHLEQYYVDRDIISVLNHLKDIQESIIRVETGETLSIVEIFEIKNFAIEMRRLRKIIKGQTEYKEIKIENLDDIIELLDPAKEGLNTFYIYDEYSEVLKEIRNKKNEKIKKAKEIKKNQKELIAEKYNIKFNIKGELYINKSEKEKFSFLEEDKMLYLSSQTPLSLIYSIKNTDELDILITELENLKSEEEEEELKIAKILSEKIGKRSIKFNNNFKASGKIDLVLAKLREAKATNSTRPEIVKESIIEIVEGRHIKTEESLKIKNKGYTPVTVSLYAPTTCITGANMGGKTVALKMIGQICLAASLGLYVPAKKCKLGLLKGIFVSIGDGQSVERGLSTFGAEVQNLSKVLKDREKRHLILIDELAGGTNPTEGQAITKSIVKYLSDKKSISVITTHFDRVADERTQKLQVAGLKNIDTKKLEEELLQNPEKGMELISENMDYRLISLEEGATVPKDAIKIAELMGMDKAITEYAKEIMKGSGKFEQ